MCKVLRKQIVHGLKVSRSLTDVEGAKKHCIGQQPYTLKYKLQ